MSATFTVNDADTKALIQSVLDTDKKVRRKTLRSIGSAIAKIQKPAMKRLWKAENRDVTGALGKSIGTKVSVKRGRTRDADYSRMAVIVGPVRGVKTKGVLKRKLYAVSRKTATGQVPVLNRKGKQLYRQPTRYAHLAGKGRKSTFVQATVTQTAAQVKSTMVSMLTEAVESKGS